MRNNVSGQRRGSRAYFGAIYRRGVKPLGRLSAPPWHRGPCLVLIVREGCRDDHGIRFFTRENCCSRVGSLDTQFSSEVDPERI